MSQYPRQAPSREPGSGLKPFLVVIPRRSQGIPAFRFYSRSKATHLYSPATSLAALTPFDWLILAIALWSIVRGLLRGLIRELFALVALLAGILAAAWNFTSFARWLSRWIPQPTSADIAAFVILALAVTLGVLLVGRIVRSAAHLVGLGPLDRIAGGLFGLARASLVGAAILMGCTTFLPPQPWIEQSRLAPTLLEIAHTAAFLAPASLQQRISVVITHLNHTSR